MYLCWQFWKQCPHREGQHGWRGCSCLKWVLLTLYTWVRVFYPTNLDKIPFPPFKYNFTFTYIIKIHTFVIRIMKKIMKNKVKRYVKFVTLDDLGRRVIVVVVSLIVFVPLVACVNSIEKLGLSWPQFVMQRINLLLKINK